jgi:hypothetical protein
MTPTKGRPWPSLVLLTAGIALLLAACGGGAASAEPGGNGASDAEVPASMAGFSFDPGEPGRSIDPDDPTGLANEGSLVVVTLDGERHEFENVICTSIGGALGAASSGVNPEWSVTVDIPPEDWESQGFSGPSIKLSGPDTTWIADPTNTALLGIVDHPGLSQIDSFTTDGYSASGTGTFMDAQAWQAAMLGGDGVPPEPSSGTFEVRCPRNG